MVIVENPTKGIEVVVKLGKPKEELDKQRVENIIVECRNKLSPIINEFRELSGQVDKPNWYNQVCAACGCLDVAYLKLNLKLRKEK